MIFRIERANFGIRVIALIIDGIIVTLPALIFIFFLTGQFSLHWTQGLIWNVIIAAYATITPVYWGGYVIGKKIMNIKIVKANGSRLTLADMFVREVVGIRILGTVTFGITTLVSGLMVLLRKDKRAIHDLLAGTIVENSFD